MSGHTEVLDEDGNFRVNDDKCSTCLFRSGRMVREVIDDARERGSYVTCHETYPHATFTPAPGIQPSLCRGYWDAYGDNPDGLGGIKRRGFYLEVPVPPADPDQRDYALVGKRDTGFTFRRVKREGTTLSTDIHYTIYEGRTSDSLAEVDSGEFDGCDFEYLQDGAWEVLGGYIGGGPNGTPYVIDVQARRGDQSVRVRASISYVDQT